MGSTHEPLHIIVVGAGIVGASIAWHIARHPSSPTVTIVAEDVGGTATPCSFAWLNASYNNPRNYYDFRRQSVARWRHMGQELPELGKLIQWSGSLIVSRFVLFRRRIPSSACTFIFIFNGYSHTTQWNLSPDEMTAYLHQHAAWGYDIHRIEKPALAALEPALDPSTLPYWAIHVTSTEEGALEPAAAAKVLLADAQQHHGARLISATATQLLRDGDSATVCGVVTSAGQTLAADHVVLAAGAGTAELAATVGVRVPLKSPPGLLVHSKPVLPPGKQLLQHVVYGPLGHVRQTADGRLLGGSDFAGGDPGDDPAATAREQFETIQNGFREEVVEEANLELEGFTVGYRPTPVDGLPILGPTGVESLTVAVMHSGVTNAARVGEVLAEYVLMGKKDSALEDFGLARFAGNARTV